MAVFHQQREPTPAFTGPERHATGVSNFLRRVIGRKATALIAAGATLVGAGAYVTHERLSSSSSIEAEPATPSPTEKPGVILPTETSPAAIGTPYTPETTTPTPSQETTTSTETSATIGLAQLEQSLPLDESKAKSYLEEKYGKVEIRAALDEIIAAAESATATDTESVQRRIIAASTMTPTQPVMLTDLDMLNPGNAADLRKEFITNNAYTPKQRALELLKSDPTASDEDIRKIIESAYVFPHLNHDVEETVDNAIKEARLNAQRLQSDTAWQPNHQPDDIDILRITESGSKRYLIVHLRQGEEHALASLLLVDIPVDKDAGIKYPGVVAAIAGVQQLE